MSKSNLELVREFHEKFSLPQGVPGAFPEDARAILRIRLMLEELVEVIEAIQLHDYVNLAKELADALYVIYGTAIEYGMPIEAIFAEVHRSNLTKTLIADSGGKILKGEDYKAPDIATVLENFMRQRKR